MVTKSIWKDSVIFFRAFLSNMLAKFAPGIYVKVTKQTGRGSEDVSTEAVADYFMDCFSDYRNFLGLDENGMEAFLKGKTVLEYGPGDVLGVALLFYANGAELVHCVDRFPLSNFSSKNIKIYNHLLDSLKGEKKKRADKAFKRNRGGGGQ